MNTLKKIASTAHTQHSMPYLEMDIETNRGSLKSAHIQAPARVCICVCI